jgi:predicted DsbA family dithiol-disulfide isomerase
MAILKVISDVVCPWCYIGKHRLAQALKILDDESITVQWLPFELNPGLPPEGMPREDYYVRKFGSKDNAKRIYENVADNARADGLPIDLDKITVTPNTRLAHRLIWLAQQHHCADDMVDKLFEAYFVLGKNISDPACLVRLGMEVGLDKAATEAFLSGDAGAREVAELAEQAYDSGAQGVPAFMWDTQWLFAGAQSPETIAMVIKRQLENN